MRHLLLLSALLLPATTARALLKEFAPLNNQGDLERTP